MKIVFATNNTHKLEEIRRMLRGSHQIVSLAEIGCHEDIPEEQDTLEGNAQRIFQAENALVRHSDSEDRDFVYINDKSSLRFVGDSDKNYEIHIRIYDNCYGNNDNRWVVIYAE